MTGRLSAPSNFICPITCDIMKDPVVLTGDGHSYEKSALELWLESHNTSPLTNEELSNRTFVMNYNLKSAIEEFCRTRDEAQLKSNFYSFTLHRGRAPNYEWRHHPRIQIIISLLGSSTVGKSCLAENIEHGHVQHNYQPRVTLAVDVYFFYLDRLFDDEYVVIVQINDCPGNDRFEAVSDRHFRNCHGAVLMIDTTNLDTLERLQNYWHKRLRERSLFENIETVLACNKIDLLERDYDAIYREDFFKRTDAFASQYQIPIFNISALRGDNIQAMFHQLISSILQNRDLVDHLKVNQTKVEERQQSARIQPTIRLGRHGEIPRQTPKVSCQC